ncbi:sarcosine oxidase subunit gamma [Bradyrhizobium sp. STM 3566]|uniref:sarcosine oxidase subunit gamma n=1 Tax=Bradyrhizobium sp. STM 3566 TaxID=578928 RepID=UPI00388F9CC1
MLDSRIPRLNVLMTLALKARVIPYANLAVLPGAAKFSFRGCSSAVAIASNAFGLKLPQAACRFTTKGARSALWLGPDEWLLQAVGEASAELFARIDGALAGHPCALVDISHRSVGFSLSGAKTEYVLNHGCPLDLSKVRFPIGMCTRTVSARRPSCLRGWRPPCFTSTSGVPLLPMCGNCWTKPVVSLRHSAGSIGSSSA